MEENEAKEEKTTKVLRLVKPSRNIKAGLIGLTNIGKTSIFNLLTNNHAPVDESCFCTIGTNIINLIFDHELDSNYASVLYYDERLATIGKLIGSAKCTHPYVSILDTAGLIRNSHQVNSLKYFVN